MTQPFSVAARFRSMRHAFSGCRRLVKEEHNARVHLFATGLVIFLALIFKASQFDWIVLTIVVSLVWITEALNTCVENLCDMVTTEFDPRIRNIKDIAAAAVLIASLTAVICGALIFIPLILSR